MKISFLSGKGGAGKTFFACSFAYVLYKSGNNIVLADFDTEEPNSYLFFEGEEDVKTIYRPLPEVDMDKCVHCDVCTNACGFNAIAILPSSSMVFPDLCHSCMGCAKLCPTNAIGEKDHETGTLHIRKGKFPLIYGKLKIGEASSISLMEEIEKEIEKINPNIIVIDGPPGNACPAIETIRYSDYVFFVIDSTPAGIEDAKGTISVAHKLGIKGGIILNRYMKKADVDREIENVVSEYGYKVLYKMPFDENTAKLYAKRELMVMHNKDMFNDILKLYEEVKNA